LFKELLDLQQPLDQICPYPVPEEACKQMGADEILAEISKGLGEPMVGIGVTELPEAERLATRGW